MVAYVKYFGAEFLQRRELAVFSIAFHFLVVVAELQLLSVGPELHPLLRSNIALHI